jgi:hypothetical protein
MRLIPNSQMRARWCGFGARTSSKIQCRREAQAPLVRALAVLLAIGPAGGSADVVGNGLPANFIGPDIPADLNIAGGGAANATLEQAAIYAWAEFIALNWPATDQGRGRPDRARGFDAADSTRVWETLRARVELYPGIGDPTAGRNDGDDYGFDAPPRYIYDPAKMGTADGPEPGASQPCSPAAPSGGVPWHNLDEPNHNNGHSGLSPEVPFPRQQILLETKVNRPNYTYVASRGWFGKAPIRPTARRTGEFVRTRLDAPLPQAIDADPRYFTFPFDTIELKAGWRRLGPDDDPGQFFISPVRYYAIGPDGNPCYFDSGRRHDDRWGLLALHIMHKTPSAPFFIWATFEHVDNLIADERDRNRALVRLENPDGSLTKAGMGIDEPYNPAVTVTAATPAQDQEIEYAATAPAPPGLGLYFTQDAQQDLPAIGRVSIRRRLNPTPNTIVSVNRAVQQLLASNYPHTPFRHYRLVAVQWRPLNKSPRDLYTGPEDPAIYYAANVIIEPSPVQQQFSGQFTAGFSKSTDYLHRELIFLNPKPNPGDPVFLNAFYGGKGYLMGGCMGCHGSRQAYGTDWSFLPDRGRVLAPEVKP